MSNSITFSLPFLSISCPLSVSVVVSVFLSGSFSHGVLALQAQVGTLTSSSSSLLRVVGLPWEGKGTEPHWGGEGAEIGQVWGGCGCRETEEIGKAQEKETRNGSPHPCLSFPGGSTGR